MSKQRRKRALRRNAQVRLISGVNDCYSLARTRLRRQIAPVQYDEREDVTPDSDSNSDAESTLSSSASVVEQWPVDAVLEHRVREGQDEFKVQWSDRKHRPSWTPAVNLQGSASRFVIEFCHHRMVRLISIAMDA